METRLAEVHELAEAIKRVATDLRGARLTVRDGGVQEAHVCDYTWRPRLKWWFLISAGRARQRRRSVSEFTSKV